MGGVTGRRSRAVNVAAAEKPLGPSCQNGRQGASPKKARRRPRKPIRHKFNGVIWIRQTFCPVRDTGTGFAFSGRHNLRAVTQPLGAVPVIARSSHNMAHNAAERERLDARQARGGEVFRFESDRRSRNLERI